MAVLWNGVRLPWLSYGTYKVPGANMETLLASALSSGYRGIDTAQGYKNEKAIGDCLHHLLSRNHLDREEVFITSKLAPASHGDEKCQQAVRSSLEALRVSYIDLYLIHWPGVAGVDPSSETNKQLRAETWRTLERFYREGVLRAIGVSNYNERHLKMLLSECSVVPHVNQCEFHPLYQQRALRSLCAERGVHFQAYSSLGTSAGSANVLLSNPSVLKVAADSARSPAQVLLRWTLQQQISVIPKSCNPLHIAENAQVDFELSDDQMSTLYSLNSDTKLAWDPSSVF